MPMQEKKGQTADILLEITESMNRVVHKGDEEQVVVALFAVAEALHELSRSVEHLAEGLVKVEE